MVNENNNEEKIVREFFSNKPGYLRTGAKKIANLLGVIDYKLVKRIKKELTTTINYVQTMPSTPELKSVMTVTQNVSPELIEAVKQALIKEGNNIPIIENERELMFGTKNKPRDQKVFKTPGIHLVMGCNHVPFHNVELHNGIRSLIEDLNEKMVGFHIIGDFCDINTLSFHDKGKFPAVSGMTLQNEYQACNDELDEFEDILPTSVVDKSFIYGNHEDRVIRFNKDMQNAKNPAILPHEALNLRFRGYSVHTKWAEDFVTLGNDLDLFHGIYFNVHNAKKHLDVFKKSCAYVHTHRSQMYREGDNAGYNIGGCADYDSAAFGYATRAMRNAWASGFALVHVDEDGSHFFTQMDVKNNRFFYNGKKY